MLFRYGHLVDFFSKMNEASLSFQEKPLPILPTIKCKTSSEFWKTHVCYHELVSFPILKGFSKKIDSNINECDFFMFVEWNVLTFGRSV